MKQWPVKKVRLYLILGGFFVANAIIAEFIGAKIFSAESTLGLTPLDFSLFGIDHLAFNMTAGVLLWPFVFVMTDIINEYFGEKGVRFFSFLSVGLIAYAFLMVFLAIKTEPAGFWEIKQTEGGSINMQTAFSSVFGQGLWIIAGSLVAFLLGQLIDVYVFHQLKKWSGERYIWLRSTGSTLVSQLIDSFIVLFIAFYLGSNWSLKMVIAVGIVNYLYKFGMAIVMTPLIYWVHEIIERYLGKELAQDMRQDAVNGRF